jgi:hypothetical protein
MASITPLIFPNFPKRPETGRPVIPELPAAPIRGGGNGNGIGIANNLLIEGNTNMAQIKFNAGVARGLYEWEFSELPSSQRMNLLTLMARISESSFRRGLQHGLYFAEKQIPLRTDPWTFRYRATLDKSPCINAKGWTPTALERLNIEHGHELLMLGLKEVIE